MSKRNRKEIDDDEYEVEQILETRMVDDKEEVLVKWKGYSNRYNTWEPKENIRTCIYESPKEESSFKPINKKLRNSTDDDEHNCDSEKENNFKTTKSSTTKSRRVKKQESQKEKQLKLKIARKDVESKSENVFDYKPPEVDKIIGKRIRAGNSVEYLIQFKNMSPKHNIWEPAENKDIQSKIVEYESQLIKVKIKNELNITDAERNELNSLKVSPNLESIIKNNNMKKINFEIFESDSKILLVKDENNFVQLDKLTDKYSFCQAVLNVTQLFQNLVKDK